MPVTGWVQSGNVWHATVNLSSVGEFSVSGVKQTQARYPAGSWAPANPEAGWLYLQAASGSTVTFAPAALASGQVAIGDQLLLHDYGCTGVYSVTAVDFTANTLTLSNDQCAGASFAAGNAFYVFGDINDVTHPGYWAFDSVSHTIYYYPTDSTFSDQLAAVASNSTEMFSITGASNVTIQGLNFADQTSPFNTSHPTQNCCDPTGTIVVSASSNIKLENNDFENVGRAIYLTNTTANSTISNNIMAYLDHHAIFVDNGANTDTITNNYIHDSGQLYGYMSAIHFSGAGGHFEVSHNAIYNTSRWAIAEWHYNTTVPYGNSRYEFNDMENTDLWGWDSAAVYMEDHGSTAYQTLGTDTIQYNEVLNEEGRHSNSGGTWIDGSSAFTECYYLDDGTSGYELIGNFCYKPGQAGIHINGGGSDIALRNNLIVYGYSSGGSVFNWSNGCGSNVTTTTTIADAPSTGSLCGAFSDSDYWSGASIPSGDTSSIVANPQFTNPSGMNFSLQSTSPAFNLGYQELPWNQMGIQ